MHRTPLVGLACALAVCGCGAHSSRAAETRPAGHFAVAPATPVPPRPEAVAAARRSYERLRDQIAAEPGAVQTRSGLVYRELSPGGGPAPHESETVTVRYQVKSPDGRIVEDSATHGGTVTVALDAIGPCLREAMLLMHTGGVSRFVCPWPQEPAGGAGAPAPVVVETTLVAVGQPLPPPGH